MDIGKNLQNWRSANVDLLPGVGAEEVRTTFRALNYDPTQDVLSLYDRVGGMPIPDQNEWRLWSLAEVAAGNSDRPDSGLYFSDYLVGCGRFLLRSNGATSAVFLDYGDGSNPMLVASTLEEFLSMQLSDPDRVLDPRSSGQAP